MKLAVIFPGIGYHCDKPLLYYSKKMANKHGYELKEVHYGNFQKDVKGSKQKMYEAFLNALEQTETILTDMDFSKYESILFISKSIGTAVAIAYAHKHDLNVNHILYTPVECTFSCLRKDDGEKCIAFHGTNDQWVETEVVRKNCKDYSIPLFIIEHANHSLETEDVILDIKNLHAVMEESAKMIQ